MYFFPEAAAEAALKTGMRASLGSARWSGLAVRKRCRDYSQKAWRCGCLRDEPFSPSAWRRMPVCVSDATFEHGYLRSGA